MAIQIKIINIQCPVCSGGFYEKERVLHGYVLVKCKQCQMVYCNPRPSEDTIIHAYTSLSGTDYDKFFGTGEVDLLVWLNKQTNRQLKNECVL